MNPGDEIYITATTDLDFVLDLLKINEIIVDKIHLASYGAGIRKIIFNPIILSRPSSIHTPTGDFEPSDRTLSGSLVVPHDAVQKGSVLDGMRLILQALFELFDRYAHRISDFDFGRLQQDLLAVVEGEFRASAG